MEEGSLVEWTESEIYEGTIAWTLWQYWLHNKEAVTRGMGNC